MKKLIVALDINDTDKALRMAEKLSQWVDLFKIGPVLFLKSGKRVVEEIKKMGKEVFLDLKFHDIPNTVKLSVESAGELGVYSLTLHSSGGGEMLKAASGVNQRPRLWAVTVLTSQSSTVKDVVDRAVLAKKNGVDGVIASPLEIEQIKKACGKDFQVITPGIRLSSAGDDQKRTATPAFAVKSGADFIVVGRPVIEAADPALAAKIISEEINGTKY